MLVKPEKSLVLKDKTVICYCAAWCRTCDQYQPLLNSLSDKYPDWTFVWADIEDHPEWLIDDDIEDFPTILIQDNKGVRFLGTLLPHIDHLEKLITNVNNLPILNYTPIHPNK